MPLLMYFPTYIIPRAFSLGEKACFGQNSRINHHNHALGERMLLCSPILYANQKMFHARATLWKGEGVSHDNLTLGTRQKRRRRNSPFAMPEA